MSRKLKPKQVQAAQLLASGDKATSIARELRLRPETLSRWKRIPEFNQLVEKVTEENRAMVRHKLSHLTEAAIEVLWSELHDYSYSSKRLQAALGVLRGGFQLDAGGPEAGGKDAEAPFTIPSPLEGEG